MRERARDFCLPINDILNHAEGQEPRIFDPEMRIAQEGTLVGQEPQEPPPTLLHQVSPLAHGFGLAGGSVTELDHFGPLSLGHQQMGQVPVLAQVAASKVPEIGYFTFCKILVVHLQERAVPENRQSPYQSCTERNMHEHVFCDA